MLSDRVRMMSGDGSNREKIKLEIDHTLIDSVLHNYVVVVRFHNNNFNFHNATSNGNDVTFFDENNSLLDFELGYFNSDKRQAIYYVKIPVVSDTVDTVFTCLYGDNADVNNENKQGVWDYNYSMVQHMGDSFLDSTGNGNNGLNTGSEAIEGLNGLARRFNGVNSVININKQVIPKTGNYTISFLSKPYSEGTHGLFCSRKSISVGGIALFNISNSLRYDTNLDKWNTNVGLSTNNWNHITLTRNGRSKEIYVDGIKKSTNSFSSSTVIDTGDVFSIGSSNENGGAYSNFYHGAIDEFIVESTNRSPEWIKANSHNFKYKDLIKYDGKLVDEPIKNDDPTKSPGSKTLLAGDWTNGYFGEVPTSQLFDGLEISNLLGFSQGSLINRYEPWLKFSIDGKIIFKSKKPYRNNISYRSISNVNALDGSRVVSKNGVEYKVRLMWGFRGDSLTLKSPDYGSRDSEWNRLMLPISNRAVNNNWKNPLNVGYTVPNWGIGFTDSDLSVQNDDTNNLPVYQFCLGTDKQSNRVLRGGDGVSAAGVASFENVDWSAYGWSPVLEVIQ